MNRSALFFRSVLSVFLLLNLSLAWSHSLQVVNVVDDSPIAGAVVTIEGQTTIRSDAQGRFEVPDSANWTLRAVGFGRQVFKAGTLTPRAKRVVMHPFKVRGIYLSQEAFLDPAKRKRVLDDLRQTSMNTLVIDVKSQQGVFLLWQHAAELKALVEQLHGEGFYVVAKLAVFKDDIWAKAHPEDALKSQSGKAVRDNDGLRWLNPADRTVWVRVIKQASQTAGLGVDEIQFDFVRFPTVAETPRYTAEYRSEQIFRFLSAARWALVPWNVFVGADLYGFTAWDSEDTRVGQRLEQLGPVLDYVSLMLYPSAFKHGAGDIVHPLQNMSRLIQSSLENAQKKTGLSALHFRPWLQGFQDVQFDRRKFARKEIADQIAGADAFGSSGYMVWRSHSDYDRQALLMHDDWSQAKWAQHIQPVVEEEIAAKHIRGAVVLLGQDNQVLLNKAYGNKVVGKAPQPMSVDTIFDLASMTKVIATTTAIMQLSEQGKIDLDAPVTNYWPEFGEHGKADITVRNLLTHYSGLKPDLDLSVQWRGYDTAMKMIIANKPWRAPGLRYTYSDINFEVLGELIQRITGQPLQAYCEQHIFKPMGMQHTRFLPPESWRPMIAPTQDLPGRLHWGDVHDATTRWMGGVAGHAGLFASAGDLAKFVQMLLNHGVYNGTRILSAASVKQMTHRESPIAQGRSHGFGWDLGGYQGYSLFPADSFGHLGYTGSMVWVQPDRKRFLILMTNRTYPDASGDARPLRKAILDLMDY